MKNLLSLLAFIFSTVFLNAQCDELFFSEYLEGYANNKALEIYNPTGEAINLSGYSIARASNGSTAPSSNQIISLPDAMLEPNDVFVVVVDIRGTSLWDSQFDKPVWNGYNVIDTIKDAITGEAIMDSLGNVFFGPQYSEDGAALFGDEYNEKYDLQCKADAFLCPDYDENNAMYFNGNDAVMLVKGSEISPTGDNLVDVIGVIGEDPEDTIMEDAWVNEDGFWLTKNRTLVRKEEFLSGRNDLTQVVFALGGSFDGEEWLSYRNNSFEFLGIHDSDCNVEEKPDRYSCSTGPVSGSNGLSSIEFEVYPNPANAGIINVVSEKQVNNVQMFDVMGKLVLETRFDIDQRFLELSIPDIKRGMYMLRISNSQNEWSIKKIIIE